MSRPSSVEKRKDKDGYVLRKGESQKSDGRYVYTYTDGYKKRRFVYARTLSELREKEKKIRDDMTFDLDYATASQMTLNQLFDRYIHQKYNLKPGVKLNYIRNYKNHVREGFGKKKIMDIRYTDVKIFYHVDKDLSVSTVENIHNAIHPAFNMAIRDQLLIRNPTDDIMAEIKSGKGFKLPEKRIALTIPEQKSFMEFLYNDKEYKGWYPIIAVLIGTGMRISEYFILPSSVHEVLIVPKNDQMDLQTLESMVKDVNATQVSPEERLSDHVYAYDAKEHELFRADKAEERTAAREAEASKEATVTKAEAKEEKKQERPSLKERLAQKKDIVAKNEATREPRQMNKDRGQALA